MSRLVAGTDPGSGDVTVDLEFHRAEGGNFFEMTGRLEASLRTTCQRCLQPLDLVLKAEPRLVLVRPGGREAPPEADVLVVEAPLSLIQLVEDELILALPMYPVHAEGQCPGVAAASRPSGKENPFSVLKGLRKTDK
jgi:uncharacterized protein